jgi:hypothetical protein
VELLATPYEPQMDTSGIHSHGEENYTRKETHTELLTLIYLGEVGGKMIIMCLWGKSL